MTSKEINFAATNDGYLNHYSAMSATHDSLKPMQYSGAVRPSRPSYQETKSPHQCCEKDVNNSPLKRKRSKSPLRQDRPSEVFSKSPESHRVMSLEEKSMIEKPSNGPSKKSSVANRSHSLHSQSLPTTNPRSTDTEACLAWLHRHCFKEIIYLERTLEEHKISLANKLDFNLTETFAFFSDN